MDIGPARTTLRTRSVTEGCRRAVRRAVGARHVAAPPRPVGRRDAMPTIVMGIVVLDQSVLPPDGDAVPGVPAGAVRLDGRTIRVHEDTVVSVRGGVVLAERVRLGVLLVVLLEPDADALESLDVVRVEDVPRSGEDESGAGAVTEVVVVERIAIAGAVDG